ncbi:MAG TPA: NAD(P)/FAD-dependent oxidoreductase [Luteibaculaceae bacterium]|nr:NAD(P)/FAD-dependent oxidoreductase [Luteibaculaceae bacterium]
MGKIAVIGGGLVGALQSLYLARKGFEVDVYERRPDAREKELKAGKSINLALSNRGLNALRELGLDERALAISIPMEGRMMHAVTGELTFQPYGRPGQCIYSVSRWGLNRELLLETEKHPHIRLFFNERCDELDLQTNTLHFTNTLTQERKVATYDRIFAADGAYSVIRQQLMKSDRFNFSQSYLEHGYKELHIPPASDGSFQLDKNALHIWPRGQFMLIALGNIDGSFTCTLFMPFEGDVSFSTLDSGASVLAFFKETFPDVVPLMPDLTEHFFQNPTSSLVTIKCNPWYHKDKVILIGDAAHGIVPFYAQGMNSGFEDCFLLDQMMDKLEGDWKTLFKDFTASRQPNTDAMAELAVYNYEEMRANTANPRFLLRKKIERHFSDKHPDLWIPLYTQVTFTDRPYSMALVDSRKQDKIMEEIMAMPDIENHWDSEVVERKIIELLMSY